MKGTPRADGMWVSSQYHRSYPNKRSIDGANI